MAPKASLKKSQLRNNKKARTNVILFRDSKKALPLFEAIQIHTLPAIRIKKLRFKIPKKAFDYLLVTSKNALQNARLPKMAKVLAIGKETASALPPVLQKKSKILKGSDSHQGGVVQFLKTLPKGQAILFLRSQIGDPLLVQKIRRMGHQLEVIHTYTTELVPLRRPLLKLLSQYSMSAFWITSPSVFSSLQKSMGKAWLKKNADIRLIAIGPTTARAIRKAGMSCLMSPKPELKAMARLSRD